MMPQDFIFVSTVPTRKRRPGALLMKLAWFACLLVIALGLLSGKSLLAAIGPVGVAVSYLLIRSGGSTKETVHIPVTCRMRLSGEEVRITYDNLDLQDGKGPFAKEVCFPLAGLKELRLYPKRQTLVLSGAGQQTFLRQGRTTEQAISFVTLHIPDESALQKICQALAEYTGLPLLQR